MNQSLSWTTNLSRSQAFPAPPPFFWSSYSEMMYSVAFRAPWDHSPTANWYNLTNNVLTSTTLHKYHRILSWFTDQHPSPFGSLSSPRPWQRYPVTKANTIKRIWIITLPELFYPTQSPFALTAAPSATSPSIHNNNNGAMAIFDTER